MRKGEKFTSFRHLKTPLISVSFKFAQVKNCVIGPNGKIIIGHNLITGEERKDLQPVYKDCDEWLKEMFYMIGSQLIYGPVEPDWSDWDWVTASKSTKGELTRHTRILENVFCFLQPTFSDLVSDLEKIADRLRSIVPSNSKDDGYMLNKSTPLEFQRVRDVLLEIRDGQIYYIYRPLVPFDVRVLDVGYIRPGDGQFVKIDSYRGRLKVGPIEKPDPKLLGARHYHSSRVPGHKGMIRHRFEQPNYATVRRMTACEAMPDSETKNAWRLFAKDARRLFEEHSPAHPDMRIQDLILGMLVTKIETDLRFSILAWSAEGGSLEPPETVQFVDYYEYENVELGNPWGYWVIDNAQGDEWVGHSIKDTRCPQNIMFLQLEAADLEPQTKL
ncbi:hypothetical protein SCHPADRAFT_301348 [Schizopora paradoxa]|uniref:Uncharacterized protein n=1 Tax=Schizopora paradoxa TaxID=27342 RepID=A0A0H2RST2_9AGAM|nr:hypothetical protein SCHPADRAFT_301348 [Schizopora paradoxa]